MERLRLRSQTARNEPSRRGRLDRSLGLTILIGLVLLLVFGLVFSVAYGSQKITTSAGSLHTADESLRSATVARAQLALAVHMASVDTQFGTNSGEARRVSVEEAHTALAEFRTGADLLLASGTDPGDLETRAGTFISMGTAILNQLDDNKADEARRSAESSLDPDFRALVDTLVVIRDRLGDEVAASDLLLGRIGNIARFLVAFFVPVAVILIYRELLRRQHRQAELETRLAAEREINAAREQFVANASHELRTPLTSIIGLSSLLAEDDVIRSNPASAELLDVIIGESDDLARMVEDLLTTARLDSGALHYVFEDVDIADEIPDSADPLVRAGLHVEVDTHPATVRADRLRLRQLLRNLLSNARKYGGDRVRVLGRVEGRTYVCEVIDNGPGIPEELIPRLFERFIHQGHQTATKDSVGLGLSIVHALAQGMGGSIAYQRIDDQTHFVLRLPLARQAVPWPRTAEGTGSVTGPDHSSEHAA